MDKINLGDRVWFEANDGEKYLMVVKSIDNSGLFTSLYPLRDTEFLLKGVTEAQFDLIGMTQLKLAENATDINLAYAHRLAERGIKTAMMISEKANEPLSGKQKNLLKQAIIHAYMQEKDHI